MASIIIVVNARYFVPAKESQPVGASSFISASATSLKQAGHQVFFVLMNHDPHALAPSIDSSNLDSSGAISVKYNFLMDRRKLQSTFQDIELLFKRLSLGSRPWFWHQSLVFLKFQPDGVPASVTCHAPFVVDVERTLGTEGVMKAFQGGQSKLEFLRREQSIGLNVLKGNANLWAWEFSRLQTRLLKSFGVPQRRVLSIPTHLSTFKPTNVEDPCRQELFSDWPARSHSTTFLTAAARNDGFKALDDLILAHRTLLERNVVCYLDIFVGAKEDHVAHKSLGCLVGLQQANYVSILPRLPQEQLVRRMSAYSLERAVFVFPSLYETYGLTAVQACICGLPVLLRNEERRIGCLADLGDAITFKGGYVDLANAMDETQKLTELPRTTLRDDRNLAEVIIENVTLAHKALRS